MLGRDLRIHEDSETGKVVHTAEYRSRLGSVLGEPKRKPITEQ